MRKVKKSWKRFVLNARVTWCRLLWKLDMEIVGGILTRPGRIRTNVGRTIRNRPIYRARQLRKNTQYYSQKCKLRRAETKVEKIAIYHRWACSLGNISNNKVQSIEGNPDTLSRRNSDRAFCNICKYRKLQFFKSQHRINLISRIHNWKKKFTEFAINLKKKS